MAKILPIESEGKRTGYLFMCPACSCGHKFCTSDAYSEGWPIWQLTGTIDNPTIRASILINSANGIICHSFITNGKLEYCGDCTHKLAGQTVELPNIE